MKRSPFATDHIQWEMVMALSGGAKLMRHLDGRYYLRGGTEEERQKLLEWKQRFYPEIHLEK